MARNYFSRSGGGTMDVIDAGNAGWDDTQARIDGIMRKRAAYRAGPMIASGDYGGAAQEYGAAGFDAEAAKARGAQEQATATAQDQAHQQQQDEIAKSKHNLEILGELTHDLAKVPPGQRAAALQQRLPILQHIGIDVQPFAALTEEQLTDDNLRAFGGEVDKAYQQMFQNDSGIYGVRPTGQVDTLHEFPRKPTIVPSGSVALGPDGKPVFTNPKTFAPKGGGGGRGGSAKRSAQDMSDAELAAIAGINIGKR